MEPHIPAARDEARADQVPRRFVLPGKRLPGLIVLLILPLAAIAGLTTRQVTLNLEQDGMQFSISHPRVQRYLNPAILTLSVTNLGSGPLTDTNVSIDRSYLDAYTAFALMPGGEYLNADALVVSLGDIAPGETRQIRAELRSDSYWSHSGTMTASSGETELAADVHSLVLP